MALYVFLKAWNTVWFVLAAILFADILKELDKELVESSKGTFITLKSPLTCCSQNALNFFHSYVVFFTVFDDLSAAM